MLYLLIYVVVSLNSSTDEYALLAFKSQISDPNKILANNWSQETSFCDWIGITCGRRHRRVRGLRLTNMGMRGTIAKEIGELSFLRSLIISNNNFQGFIPVEVGNLNQLREIEMQYDELNGSIPLSFGFLVNLQKLNISGNILSGDIPNKIFNVLKQLSGQSPVFCKGILEFLKIVYFVLVVWYYAISQTDNVCFDVIV
ncbi:LRR receptor-like serine/threonine-protein kinase EFR [Olea europaea var. sylvestris]|uniref:LRR receptor-like serine/threonine-protein kinase EFR n=1 Tax=Olea europaea var. sylvestris TaxID=158386 RepID=UPI000C1D3B59|nr:LRR receptor-like serine/threonine-protein kinase EFR [Olea europaea var. sylvestris]